MKRHYLHLPLLNALILHVFFLQCHMIITQALDANTDRQALLSFRLGITNDPENVLYDWNTTSSHCTWFGVSCIKNQRVGSISLVRHRLSGTLSPHLSNLTSLETLSLSGNSFSGQIPPEFGFLSNLKYFSIAANSLSGTIPPTLVLCHDLRVISVSFNELTGHLPQELGSLKKLVVFNATANNFTGSIPRTFGNLSSLSTLSLARNKLYGSIPNELGRLTNLVTIQLSDNKFSGKFPESIFNISSLVYLSVVQNNLSGTIPPDLASGVPNIEQLFLGKNKFNGLIPESISNLSRIQFVDFSCNYFQGPLPIVGKSNRLVYLNLGDNNLTSTTELNSKFFDSLANSTQLISFQLFFNRLSGELPISIANLSDTLCNFSIENNLFTGSFPNGIEKYQDLITLTLENNNLTGQFPPSVGAISTLQRLYTDNNMFSGQIPDIFGNLTVLFQLTMGGNKFSGEIPVSIGNCQQLEILKLSKNNLTGIVPKEIFGLFYLRVFDLSLNNLHGLVPEEIGNLNQLDTINLSGNNFSGSFPESIGGCLSMHYFNVSRNSFEGSILRTLGKLVALESLDLSENAFSGPIPSELEKLSMLKNLSLSFNKLEGRVPSKGFFRNLGRGSIQGNSRLCGSDQKFATRLRIHKCDVENIPNIDKHSNSSPKKTIILVVGLSAFLFVMSCLALACIFYRRKMKTKARVFSLFPLRGSPPKISYADIQRATNGFSQENLIGKGSFGSVYKGVFGAGENGVISTLAIKVLDLEQSKASKSFSLECEALKNIRHRNIVRVVTTCSSINHKGDDFKAIVMKFMANGSLEDWLYPNEAHPGVNLSIEQRMNVAIDVACALDYLHHDCEPPIVHCDLKPLNILLDENMGAHVGDFGLSRFLLANAPDDRSTTMGLKGSVGYIAPEYGFVNKASTKGDVYSFGILLLELILGKKPTDEMFKDGLNLITFASAVDENQNFMVMNGNAFYTINTSNYTRTYISNQESSMSNTTSALRMKLEECVSKTIKVGLCCSVESVGDRITMREALAKLNEIKKTYKANVPD